MNQLTKIIEELEAKEATGNATAIEDNPELMALLWDSMRPMKKQHGQQFSSARVNTGWGTKTRAGLIASIKRAIAQDWNATRARAYTCGECGHSGDYREIDRADPIIIWCDSCGAENMTLT